MPSPKLLLDVPLVGQVRQMDCWYAGTCMLAYYREAGPRLGLPARWLADSGVDVPQWARLAQVEGLKPVVRPSNVHSTDKFGIFSWLSSYGPIMAFENWYGFGHAIVLTGIDGDTISINDPDDQKGGDDGRRTTETVSWFNSHQYWQYPDALLYKPAPAGAVMTRPRANAMIGANRPQVNTTSTWKPGGG